MRRRSSFIVRRSGALALVLAAMFCLTGGERASTQASIEDLIARNIEAKGGLARLRAILTIKLTGTQSMQGTNAAVKIYTKRPNFVRQETVINGKLVTSGFDGQTAWMHNPFVGTEPMVMSGPQAELIREQSNFDGPLVDYKNQGYMIAMQEMESAGDRSLIHLRLTSRTGQVSHMFLDAVTYLEARLRTEAGPTILDQEFSDYRDVEGVKMPFLLRTFANGALQGELKLQKIEVNTPMDDALFRVGKAY